MTKLPCVLYVTGSDVVPETVPEQASVVVGVGAVAEHSATIFGSVGVTGAVTSFTNTFAVQLLALPAASVPTRVTELLPRLAQLNVPGAAAPENVACTYNRLGVPPHGSPNTPFVAEIVPEL